MALTYVIAIGLPIALTAGFVLFLLIRPRVTKRWLRDLYLHLWHGTLCHLYGRHRVLANIAVISKNGFRGIPLMQCRKCFQFHVDDAHAKRWGGK